MFFGNEKKMPLGMAKQNNGIFYEVSRLTLPPPPMKKKTLSKML